MESPGIMPGLFQQRKENKMSEKNLVKVTDEKEKTLETAEETVNTEALIVNEENVEEIVKSGKGVLKLKKEIEIDGKMTDSIYFDLSSLNGLQYRNIIREVEKKNKIKIQGQPAGDIDVQIAVFAKASDIPTAVLQSGLSIKEMALATTVAYAFLMA